MQTQLTLMQVFLYLLVTFVSFSIYGQKLCSTLLVDSPETVFYYNTKRVEIVNVEPNANEVEIFQKDMGFDGTRALPVGINITIDEFSGHQVSFYSGSIDSQSNFMSNFFRHIQKESKPGIKGQEREYGGLILVFDDNTFSKVEYTSNKFETINNSDLVAELNKLNFSSEKFLKLKKVIWIHTHPFPEDDIDVDNPMKSHLIPSIPDFKTLISLKNAFKIRDESVNIDVLGIILPTSKLNQNIFIEYFASGLK